MWQVTRNITLFILAVLCGPLACQVHDHGHSSLKETTGHHHPGDRVGGHGMALFGSEQKFIAHIPMMMRPHNEQLVASVVLLDAESNELDRSFADQGYSIAPTGSFSLDDLANGDLMEFKGTIHRGNFEHRGPAIVRNVTIKIVKVLVARNLSEEAANDDNEQDPETTSSYYLLGSGTDLYGIHKISAQESWQQIVKLKNMGENPLPVSTRRVLHTTTARNGSLEEAANVSLLMPMAGSDQGTDISLRVTKDLWCLKGPDFFEVCD